MMNVIRRSQIIGLMTMDGSTATEYDHEVPRWERDRVEEIWLDENGRVVYLAGQKGYTPTSSGNLCYRRGC